jgi:hypothetical protein
MADSLHERIRLANVWSDRPVSKDIADATIPVVAAWLRELAAEQWSRATNHFDPHSRELATIRAMYLTDRAIELEGSDDILTEPYRPALDPEVGQHRDEARQVPDGD